MPTDAKSFGFDNTLARELETFYVPWQGERAPSPEMVLFNRPLAEELGLDADGLNGAEGAAIFSGSEAPEGASPLAQVYAGHQFGGFSPQLGDGRALLLGEVIDRNGHRRDIQLKGSGRTPFSRRGDGKAVLGPVLREYLMAEAMHALGVPTSRGLAVVKTGEGVMREDLEQGAVFTRVAASHLRVGSFQFFAAQKDLGKVRRLADYAIKRHYQDLTGRDDRYLAFLRAVIKGQATLVAHWMLVGFVHGVMNTDNMALAGETIDYGPCAFIDTYHPEAVFSSIDYHGRYAYGNQPRIAHWNLARLAETLLDLFDDDKDNAIRLATNEINAFPASYEAAWLDGMRTKLGLGAAELEDLDLANGLLKAMEAGKADYTLTFRSLADSLRGRNDGLESAFSDHAPLQEWLVRWRDRLLRDPKDDDLRADLMDSVNPLYIPRNHKVEEAIMAATYNGDMRYFDTLHELLKTPYARVEHRDDYAIRAPADAPPFQTFCGT